MLASFWKTFNIWSGNAGINTFLSLYLCVIHLKTLYKTFVFMCYWPITRFLVISYPKIYHIMVISGCSNVSQTKPQFSLARAKNSLTTKTNPCNSNCNCRTVQMVQNSTNDPRFHSRVCSQMYPQITCLNRCVVALLAFVWLCSRVSLQFFMCLLKLTA